MVNNLFVGQRVRLVGCEWNGDTPNPTGLEGRLRRPTGPGVFTGKWYEWTVDTDCGRSIQCDSHEVEPILPEGAQPSEFSFTELMDNLGVVVA